MATAGGEPSKCQVPGSGGRGPFKAARGAGPAGVPSGRCAVPWQRVAASSRLVPCQSRVSRRPRRPVLGLRSDVIAPCCCCNVP